jgi:hypothetical protein
MRVFWAILLLLLAIPPLLIPLCGATARKDFWRKSAIETVTGVVPRKYQCVVAVLYLALVIFAAGKVKGLL